MKQIIIVGSGIAGLTAAIELAPHFEVTLVTKARLAESNTRYAQGGIAAAMSSDDTIAEHIEDTMAAGAGLSDLRAVEVLCADGPERIRQLIQLGVAFDQQNGELARGLEAAHSHPRVLHAGGDATGLAIENALVDRVRRAGVKVLENTFALDLVLENGHTAGLSIIDDKGLTQTLEAQAVILASGGAGQLFTYTTNPKVATGDGVAVALRAGAVLADVEFYQFHPTALAVPGNFLVSEAVRGDGAVLRAADGSRFMLDVHPRAELAPRDVVARGIAAQMAKQAGKPVMLDASALGKDFLAERFPTIDAASRKAGFDWSREPVPVTPAAHYWMGGIQTDLFGRTSIPGLFAVGECACTGVHGANRLASNSLLESIVFAWRAAHFLVRPENAGAHSGLVVKRATLDPKAAKMVEKEGCVARETLLKAPLIENEIASTREQIQALMWTHSGIYRNRAGLNVALTTLTHAQIVGNAIRDLETRNLLAIASVMVTSALARCESRGAHYRSDFPDALPAFHHHFAISERPR